MVTIIDLVTGEVLDESTQSTTIEPSDTFSECDLALQLVIPSSNETMEMPSDLLQSDISAFVDKQEQ